MKMVFGTINYWEGALTVEGMFDDEPVTGSGFLELVGYPSKYSNIKFCKSKLANLTTEIKQLSLKLGAEVAKDIKRKTPFLK